MGKKGSRHESAKSSSGAAAKKKQISEDFPTDSYVIFSNSDKETKRKNQNSAAGSANQGTSLLIGEASKRVDVKKLVGGPSWTGKLPVNMLSEHCQKQKWEKPEYTMSKTEEGYSSMVILKARNPKTKELEALPPFKLPQAFKHLAVKPSALEARHFAAAYGLFRVCSMRNIHMMMPPDYRILWKGQFQTLKEEDIKQGRQWMYQADPFVVLQERNEVRALTDKKRAELEKSKEIALKAAATRNTSLQNFGTNVPALLDNGTRSHPRTWHGVPTIEMGKRTRARIENLVQKYGTWNLHRVELSKSQQNSIIAELQKLGFRPSHIEEAVQECKDREETLDWLLIHVPEDDLPRWALPEGYEAGISMASSDLKREGIINRLAEAGYSIDHCKKQFDHFLDEGKAAEALQEILISNTQNLNTVESSTPGDTELSSEMRWEEEMSSLHAVFGDRFTRPGKNLCRVSLQPVDNSSGVKSVLQFRKSLNYPAKAPVVSIHVDLPAYIRLSIIKKTLNHMINHLLDEPMLFFTIDWVERNIIKIIERPGKLREVSNAASTVSTISDSLETKNKRQQIMKNPKILGKAPNLQSKHDWVQRQAAPKLKAQLEQRKKLPAWEMKEAIIDTISSYQISIISGETGSGKSTQCPQFLLDDMYEKCLGESIRIICTQPRRISAMSLADRVSDERCSAVGQEVGYVIRGESKTSQRTKITYVTAGVLLRRLQTSGGCIENIAASVADITHIMIDEVHERNLDTDFLLCLLRDILSRRKDLKLILMSATLDAGIFEEYFRNFGKVGRIEISGRTYPIDDYYLDDIIRMTSFDVGNKDYQWDDNDNLDNIDEINVAAAIQDMPMRINYDLISKLVRTIDKRLTELKQNYGILIFMPGVSEINRVLDCLQSIPNLYVLPLYASLQSIEQRKVFPNAPPGKRKVIVSTNVAETSITIDDIVAVIDSGRVKEISYDPLHKIRKLEESWASRAACKQRRGRAGRVQAGKCYKLFTRNIEIKKMAERPEPEIRRVPLEQLCLSVRAMGITEVNKFLASALTPPDCIAVEDAMNLLRRIEALDGNKLTALGHHLSVIPSDLRCGKLMLYGAIFGCLDACVTIAAILTAKSPFISPPKEKRENLSAIRSQFAQNHGDLIGDLRAFEKWIEISSNKSYRKEMVQTWCYNNFLSYQNLNEISSNKAYFLASLHELSFISSSSTKVITGSLNRNNSNTSLIRCLCAGAFNPQIVRISFPEKKFAPSISGAIALDPEAKTIKYFNEENNRVFIHPSSTLFNVQSFPGNSNFLAYFNKIATSKVFIRELTPFNSYTALLFSGPITLDTFGRGIIVDNWLRLKGWARIGVLVNRLRCMLDNLLAKKIDDPELSFSTSDSELLDIVLRLIEFDGLDQ
ncbi:putative ATP-dependent RNA helicase ucp12 [Golovinomyces cichoracearum]|uniref:Putative ATP-dependent RNA helicase ucp12 n=1 Tax=Golovinomyces cichoracearum TaxID=62708 RepID=A0A420IRP1_9PEZI|nr:putative ATP-dependent RNA helicase ucp12 [Golovinomyces cichoracearum]